MKNRDKLNGMAIYDLLCRMAKNSPYCIIETITGKAYKCPYGRSLPDCHKCIAAWLNEEAEKG